MSGFTFGAPAKPAQGNDNANKTLFGATTTAGGTGSSLFGSTPATSGASTSNGLFGSGGTGGTSNLFGNPSSTPAVSKPSSSFGQTAPSAAPAPSFGAPSAGPPKPSLFGTASTGNAPTSSVPSLFGNAGAFTPAANKTSSFLSSTTPAGPPPGTSVFNQGSQPASGSSIFSKPSAASGTSTPNPFGGIGASSTTPAAKPAGSLFNIGANKDVSADANKTTPANPFGGMNLGANSSTQGTPVAPKSSLFNIGSTTPAATPASKPAGFSFAPTSGAPASTTPTTGGFSLGGNKTAPASTGAPTSNLFQTGATPGAGSAPTGGSGLSFNMPKPPASTPGATPVTAPTASTGGGFSFMKPAAATPGSTPAAASTGAAPASTTAPSFLSNLGLGAKTTPTSTGAASTSTATPSLFPAGGLGATKPTTSTTAPAPTAGLGATLGGDANKTTGLGSSTAGPAPSAQSRLKNKSMDEIITRWAADLSKYQKEFQSQAETVARWDRALVENSDKVKTLYSKTWQAEKDAAEVERQLTLMEENQAELDDYLNRYEKEIDNMMNNHGVGRRSEGLRGPDQERERTYKLAEKLQLKLNDLNKDLTEMIDEINNTSQTLSKTGKPDDPLTKVVRVLNSQLSQLQLIDSGAAQLQEKISKAQKESRGVGSNGWNGLGTDPSEDFYRSFRGGRSERFGGVS